MKKIKIKKEDKKIINKNKYSQQYEKVLVKVFDRRSKSLDEGQKAWWISHLN